MEIFEKIKSYILDAEMDDLECYDFISFIEEEYNINMDCDDIDMDDLPDEIKDKFPTVKDLIRLVVKKIKISS